MDEAMIKGLEEQKEELDLAKDYRRLSATEFFHKHIFSLGIRSDVSDDWISKTNIDKLLEKLDAGIETLDWIS